MRGGETKTTTRSNAALVRSAALHALRQGDAAPEAAAPRLGDWEAALALDAERIWRCSSCETEAVLHCEHERAQRDGLSGHVSVQRAFVLTEKLRTEIRGHGRRDRRTLPIPGEERQLALDARLPLLPGRERPVVDTKLCDESPDARDERHPDDAFRLGAGQGQERRRCCDCRRERERWGQRSRRRCLDRHAACLKDEADHAQGEESGEHAWVHGHECNIPEV